MRILLINWAKIWDGAASGGGVNGYCQSLALELVSRGHDVAYLFAGVTSTPAPLIGAHPGATPCTIRRHADWLGVRVFEAVDSPVLAPAAFQFRDPAGEAANPGLAATFGAFVRRLEPDVVHFHNIEGLSADCIRAIREPGEGPVVVYSIHNYHTICPQAYLLRNYTTPCMDFEGGVACETCIEAPDPGAERAQRAAAYARSVGFTSLSVSAAPAAPDRPALPDYEGRLAGVQSRAESRPLAVPLPGQSCDGEAALAAPLPFEGSDSRGQTAAVRADRDPPRRPGPMDPEWQPVRNELPREPRVDPEDPAANRYGVRRSRMIDALNTCDRVLAVSNYVKRRYEAAGVRPELLSVQHIGTRINRTVDRLRELAFEPPPFDPARPRPIRLVFMGYNSVYKGLPMLADTLELLTPEYLARFHLFVFAQAGQSIEWRFRRMEPRLGGLTVFHGYQHHDIPWMLGGKDVGVVPSVWWDNAPQTVFEFFSCGLPVLAANIGGIPDFVEEGRNGLLFTANDRFDLARRLVEIARDPATLERLRRNVRPPKDIQDHALELETVYSECLSSVSLPSARGPEVRVVVAPGAGRGASSVGEGGPLQAGL